ncbi:helix-turn-helix transcriptional regulator [uncultured Oscillibacter sp.]|uniref:helix-turn-helix domain-containing protein n=1 Tax=uncultured Oscillibacter sp. TaxID=876091 RepID=UPI0026183E43|nr:helix-turn-helix transcriptional regulator [uncultured Oscillibacter sp.]
MQFNSDVVGQVIRKLRKEKKISQDVLSGFAGIARTHLTMIENGSKQPNFETIWKIAMALDLRPSELVSFMETEIERRDKESTLYMEQ